MQGESYGGNTISYGGNTISYGVSTISRLCFIVSTLVIYGGFTISGLYRMALCGFAVLGGIG